MKAPSILLLPFIATLVLLIVSANSLAEDVTAAAKSNGEEVDGVVVTGMRARLEAEFLKLKPVSDHLEAIRSPRRRIAAVSVGLAATQIDGSRLLVVGPLTEADLKQLLAGAELQSTLSKVVGDKEYARIYFGDPEKDPCCFGEWTFSKESGQWKRIFEYWRSH